MIWSVMLVGLLACVAVVSLGILVWFHLVERDRRQAQQRRRVFESWREPRQEHDLPEGERIP